MMMGVACGEGVCSARWAWSVVKGRGLARWAGPHSRSGRPWRHRERRSDHYTDKIKASWTGSKSAYVVCSRHLCVKAAQGAVPCRITPPLCSQAEVPCCTEDVWQNSHHDQQHRPGPQDGAAAQDRGLHREDKGIQSLGRPDAVLRGARQEGSPADGNPSF